MTDVLREIVPDVGPKCEKVRKPFHTLSWSTDFLLDTENNNNNKNK